MRKLVTIELDDDGPPGGQVVAESQQRALLAKIVGMGSTEHPTDIAKDKDKLIGEAVWEEICARRAMHSASSAWSRAVIGPKSPGTRTT
jgi:hypothetical protein